MGNLQIIDEKHKGLVSTVILLCNMCGYKTEKSTENPCEQSTINYGAVWGTLSTGGTYAQLTGLLGALDIPSMSYRLFHNIEIELGDKWIEGLWKSMEEAGIKERELAIAEGQLDSDGIPWTTVYCDGGWSHRSYGHSYNASSGVAVIIGKFTKKLLYLGVRNKYCSFCARYESKNEPVPLHTCYKNWQGSSTAMETSIIVEGFKQSQILHGLKFLQFIADGDSSVYAKIREEVAYGQYVTKIECRNHAIKNYGKALYKIKADTTVNKEARALLTNNKIKELQNCCTKIINSAAYADVENLKANLEKSIDHVFGNHAVCSDQYCTKQQQSDAHLMTLVKNTGLYFHINGSLQRLISKGHRLIDKETNNRAEMYMSILCKFNAGKRLNLSGRGSFRCRSAMSGLRYNEGVEWQEKEWRSILKRSPGKYFKQNIQENQRAVELKSKRKLDFVSPYRKKRSRQSKKNTEYGPHALQPSLTEDEYQSEYSRILKTIQVQPEEIPVIERQTVGQWNNAFYRHIKRIYNSFLL
ncbi:uncharacterized protein [Diabrotica undecimpunctata]|uniref:uncharacterized protein n=1 Tax=Diabrotica undecimpunctata TaxID=50387 RepID=UPI003B634BD2